MLHRRSDKLRMYSVVQAVVVVVVCGWLLWLVVVVVVGVVLVELLILSIALVGFAIYADDPRFFMADGSVNRAMAEEIILRIGYEQLPVVVGSLLLAAGAAISASMPKISRALGGSGRS